MKTLFAKTDILFSAKKINILELSEIFQIVCVDLYHLSISCFDS